MPSKVSNSRSSQQSHWMVGAWFAVSPRHLGNSLTSRADGMSLPSGDQSLRLSPAVSRPQSRSRSCWPGRLTMSWLGRLLGRRLSLLLLVATEGLTEFLQVLLGQFSLLLFSGQLDSRDHDHNCDTASDPQDNRERGEDRTVVQQQFTAIAKRVVSRVAAWRFVLASSCATLGS